MKTIMATIASLILGFMGVIYFFGSCDNLIKLAVSKPLGILMIYLSYKIYMRIKKNDKSYN